MVFNNDDLPPNKRVYYSDHHFRPLGKKGEPISTVIAPYDNTGYRTYTGISLNIFFNEKECKDFYVNQCKVNIQRIEEAKIRSSQYFDQKISEIETEMEVFV